MHTDFPADYMERVYAGVLGKIIGVYLGRPFEGWSYERIMRELGEINYYVHDKLNVPLVVTDDDISGTFTFLRALPDYGYSHELTPEQIGQTWLNYIIEERTILWWGGLGNSTEHTAYLRLKQGIPAPLSGSIQLNGQVVAEQIGAQIFIDGWGMVAPGNPALAAELARKAASVSHDGEAIYGAQVIAAMEAQAFIEHDLNKLLDCGLSFIPQNSLIYRLIQDIRAWHASGQDWHRTREYIVEHYGYDTYSGNCHIIPNHALIILALLYGNDDFQRSLMIVNTCGWDTDCNSGNVGCLLGIKNGLATFDQGPDWRGPIADRLYIPTADGGRAITNAVAETYHIVRAAYALSDKEFIAPKQGAQFNFELPGSVQGFQAKGQRENAARLENVAGHSRAGKRSLALRYSLEQPREKVSFTSMTFIPVDALHMSGYGLMASPTLYSGQHLHAILQADESNSEAVTACLVLQYYGEDDQLIPLQGPEVTFSPGQVKELTWRVPDTNGAPIAEVGIIVSAHQATNGSLYLDSMSWDGTPQVTLGRPTTGGDAWRRAWVDGLDQSASGGPETYRCIQNHGRGLLIQGAREWTDYQVSATITPHLAKATGIGARVQGMRRYYALLLTQEHQARLLKVYNGKEQVLDEVAIPWELYRPYTLRLQVVGTQLQGWIDNQLLLRADDHNTNLSGGGIALICEEGRVAADAVTVQPIGKDTHQS